MRGLDIFSFKGRLAPDTGSSKGLGWAMVQALAVAGARVVLNSRDPNATAPPARPSVAVSSPRLQRRAAFGEQFV
jgi:NAD(P)-dependent dehydrogenase (short-subunit alcohol dehydrogenase family)